MPKKLHDCVRKVKGRVRNPWAVCNASLRKKKKAKKG